MRVKFAALLLSALSAAAAAQGEEWRESFYEARRLMAEERWEEASGVLEGLAGSCRPEVLASLVAVSEKLNRMEALREKLEAGRGSEGGSCVSYALALLDEKLGRPAEALALMEETVRARPDERILYRDLERLWEQSQSPDSRRSALLGELDAGPGRGCVLMSRGRRSVEEGRIEEAAARFEEAASFFEASGDAVGRAEALGEAATWRSHTGEYETAVILYRQAADAAESAGDTLLLARLSLNTGVALDAMGNYTEGRRMHERATELAAATGEPRLQGYALDYAALDAVFLGHYGEALALMKQAQEIWNRHGDERSRGFFLNDMGIVFQMMGESGKALRCFERAAAERRKRGDLYGTAEALTNAGTVYAGENGHRKALSALAETIGIWKKIQHPLGEATARLQRAAAWEALGRRRRARHELDEAERQALALHAGALQTGIMLRRAEMEKAAGRLQEAEARAAAALSMAQEREAAEDLWQARAVMASIRAMQGESAAARENFEEALRLVEALRMSFGSADSGRISFLSARLGLYETYAGFLLGGGAEPEDAQGLAFRAAENMKARSLLDQMAASRFLREGVPPELLEKKILLEAKIERLKVLNR
jgi:tetratricopeptide (TPR) repeat protein